MVYSFIVGRVLLPFESNCDSISMYVGSEMFWSNFKLPYESPSLRILQRPFACKVIKLFDNNCSLICMYDLKIALLGCLFQIAMSSSSVK